MSDASISNLEEYPLNVTYSYADACRNIFNTIKTSGHSSLEKYTSHFIWKSSKGLRKVLSVRGELETEQNCNILTPPQLFWIQQHFFRVLLGYSTRGLGAQPLLGHGSDSSILSPTDLNFQLPGLYNNLTTTYFLRASQFAPSSTLRQSGLSPDPLISSTRCTCYLHRCISHLTARPGRRSICYMKTRLVVYQIEKVYAVICENHCLVVYKIFEKLKIFKS